MHQFLINIHLLYNPIIPVLGIYPSVKFVFTREKKKTSYMTVYSSFIHDCENLEISLSTGEWINKLSYSHTMNLSTLNGKNE